MQVIAQTNDTAIIFKMRIIKAFAPEYQQFIGSLSEDLWHICCKGFKVLIRHEKYRIVIRVHIFCASAYGAIVPSSLTAFIFM
ncbi:hypothetical protein D3C76_1444700 [compost metagenome]